MAFGINIYKADGSVRLNMTQRLTRFIFHKAVAAGASSNENVTGLVAANAKGFAQVKDDSFGKIPHTVTVTDGNVAWAAPVSGSVDCDIFVVHYK